MAMRHEAGPRIDWLFEQPEAQGEDTAALLRHLQELEGNDPRIDSLAPFLMKEQQAHNIWFSPDNNRWIFRTNYNGDRFLDDHLSSLAELLHSSRVPQHYMRNYSIGDLLDARQKWDNEYDDDQWQDISYPYQIREYQEAAKKRERELAYPHQERQGLKPIEPSFDWHTLARNIDDYDHIPAGDLELAFEAARNHGGISDFANAAHQYLQKRKERRLRNFEPMDMDELTGTRVPKVEDYDHEDGTRDWDGFTRDYDAWRDSPEYQQEKERQFLEDWDQTGLGHYEQRLREEFDPYWNRATNAYQNEPFLGMEQIPGQAWGDIQYPQWGQPEDPVREPKVPWRNEPMLFEPNGRQGEVRFSPEQQQMIQDEYGRYWTEKGHEAAQNVFGGGDYWNDSLNHGFWNKVLHDPTYPLSEEHEPFYRGLGQRVGPPQNVTDPWTYARTAKVLPKGLPGVHTPHLNRKGQKCWCGYGIRFSKRTQEHLGSIHEAAQFDYLKRREDIKRHPNRENLIKILEGYGPEYDKLLPWMVREFKQGRLIMPDSVDRWEQELNDSKQAYENWQQTGEPWKPNRWDTYDNENAFERHINELQNRKDSVLRYGFEFPERDNENLHRRAELTGSSGIRFDRAAAYNVLEWLNDLKKRDQGINLDQKGEHTHLDNVLQAAYDHRMEQENEDRDKDAGTIVHSYPNGWTLRHITDGEQAELEGNDMGHCIGNDEYGHPQRIDSGSEWNLSLRDQHNFPHATMELEPQMFKNLNNGEIEHFGPGNRNFYHGAYEPIWDNAKLIQVQGKEDSIPIQKYRDMLQEWFDMHGIPYDHGRTTHNTPYYDEYPNENDAEEFEPWWDDVYYRDQARTPDEYLGMVEGTHDGPEAPDEYWRAHSDAEEHGLEGPELYDEPHDWPEIIDNLRSQYVYGEGYKFDPDKAKELYDAAWRNGDWGELMGHAKDYVDQWGEHPEFDPEDNSDQNAQWWLERIKENTHPETGELTEPTDKDPDDTRPHWERSPEPFVNTWWRQKQEAFPQLPGWDWQTEGNEWLQPMPQQIRQQYFPEPQDANSDTDHYWQPQQQRITSTQIPSVYVRWVFNPQDATVRLDTNDGHPAYTKTHGDLGGDPNLFHGYAYRINGGWRLTDYTHRPVEDPFIVATVMRALKGQQAGYQGEDWTPVDYDYDQAHYGLPLPID